MTFKLVVLAGQAVIGFILLSNAVWLRREKRKARAVVPEAHVTIVIPARNEAENLRRLLPSVLAQRYPRFDVVMYDDASEDETWEVAQSFAAPRMRTMRGAGPPPGWIGKVHALYAATRDVHGDVLLFLDADTELVDTDALARIAARHAALPGDAVLSGLTRLCGGGRLLVSLVPFSILGSLPLPLTRRLRFRSLSALNGQCWMIRRDLYLRLEPHRHVRREVLEDVKIGRYLKSCGVTPYLLDLQDDVRVYMYRSTAEAWRGFRKNTYEIMGGHPLPFALFFSGFLLVLSAAPLFSPWFLLSSAALKLTSDRQSRFPPSVSLLAPLSLALASALQLDSALHHWLNRVSWKGRRIE